MSQNEPSELAKQLCPPDFWDSNNSKSPFHPKWGEKSFRFFLEWRPKNEITPIHLAIYDFLSHHGYEWGNLMSSDLEDHPYFIHGDKKKFSEINQIAIAFSFAQVFVDGRIDANMKTSCLSAIDRELKIALDEGQKQLLIKFRSKIESIKVIGIRQMNTQIFKDYFEKKEEN